MRRSDRQKKRQSVFNSGVMSRIERSQITYLNLPANLSFPSLRKKERKVYNQISYILTCTQSCVQSHFGSLSAPIPLTRSQMTLGSRLTCAKHQGRTHFCSLTQLLTFSTTSSLSRCNRSPFARASSRDTRRVWT